MLLVLLLRFVRAGVVDVHGATLAVCLIRRAAVPHVGVHDDDRTRFSGYEEFAVCLFPGFGRSAPMVRTRHDSQRAVGFGEIVKHPDGIADGVPAIIGEFAAIDMQRLFAITARAGGADVQAAQFEFRPEDGLHAFQNLGSLDDLFEDFALIDEIGQPARAGLLLEFASRAVAFLSEKLIDTRAETLERGFRKK